MNQKPIKQKLPNQKLLLVRFLAENRGWRTAAQIHNALPGNFNLTDRMVAQYLPELLEAGLLMKRKPPEGGLQYQSVFGVVPLLD